MLNRLRKNTEGFSLIELMVVLLVLGVVSGIVMRATIVSLEASRKTQERVLALADLTKGLERIGRELRSADPLDLSGLPDVASAPYEVGSQVIRGDQLVKFRYYLTVDANGVPELREDVRICPRTSPNCATPLPGSGDGLFIVNTVNATLGIPLLTYFDRTGAEMSCTSPAVLSLPDCQAFLATADQVRLTLVRSLPEQEPVRIETFINIRQARFT